MSLTTRVYWVVTLGCCVALSAVASAGELTIGDRTLVVADGYEVERVAAPPLVDRPISIAMDEAGRLYVTDSAGMSDKADVQIKAKPHRIRRLEDTDGDGVFDKSVVFADGLMIPQGCMWYRGSLYVAAPPQILKLTDADGDGVAEKREVWFDGKTLTGCANDVHGPYLGRDGWFYWTKGAFAEQTYTLPNGKPFVTRASHVFRATADGKNIEPVMTGGMDNPVGVAFLSNGERIVSGTFFQHPAGGKRDGLLHAVYGGVYGKDHAVLDGHVRTGSLMPIMTHMGAAAPAGLIAGSAGLFGGGHEDDLLACYFNLRKVVLHRLKATGATYETQEQDLLSCEHPDFHPTDVLEDADGSVLIVDTGGWYKVCCPTSVLARPDVPGAIYRVRKKGQAKVDDPLGLKLPWATMSPKELAALLADKRLFVRRRAQDLLRQAGADGAKAAVLFLRSTADVGAAREAVWTLGGIGGDDARWGVRRALTHPSPEVVRSAVHAAGLWRDGGADDAINKLVLRQVVRPETRDGVFRPAAEALGRIGGPKAVHAVSEMLACGTGSYEVDATGTPTDADQRVLQHSLIYALIELGDIDHLQRMLAGPGARYRRGGLVAMASLDPDRIRVADLLPLLRKDPEIANTVTWLASRQPKWGPAFATYLRERVSELPEEAHLRDRLAALLVACTPLPDVQVLVAERLRTETNPARRSLLLTAMRQARLTSAPAAWCDVVADQLVAAPDGERTELLAIARTLAGGRKPHDGLTTALLGLAARTTLPAATRIDALSVAGAGVSLDDALLADVLKMTAATEPATVRQSAVAVVGAAKLTKAQHVLVVDALATAGPMELPKLLAVLEKADANEETGRRMLTAVRKSPGLVSLRPEQINPLIALFPQSVRDAAADLTSRRSATAAEQGAHLDALLAALPPGDVARGQGVFIGKKAACVSCHATGYLGGKLGPDLTGIGKIRSDRDLLEAIVYPSSGFVRGYEPVIVETKDGEKHVGIITTESRDEIQLAVGPQETRSLSREQISDQRPGQNSLMPDGMSAVLSQQELADLLAFLRAAKR